MIEKIDTFERNGSGNPLNPEFKRSARSAALSRPQAGENFADLDLFQVGNAALTPVLGRQIKSKGTANFIYNIKYVVLS